MSTHSMDVLEVAIQATSLSKCLHTLAAFVGSNVEVFPHVND